MTNEWNFPHNGFGQVRGVSDAGIETFTGTEIQSLAREICQNSLDAAMEGKNATVRVEFEQYRISSSDIPGYEQYASKIKKAYDYWSKKNSEKTIKVLDKALNSIKQQTTIVLRISDFNTTGLSHPYEDSDEGWNALTKLDGGATKTGDKAGAFGIGKNAPFTNSNYRLVFYRTLNEAQETAAQGMSRFISFPENLNDSMNTMTTGIGYYGNPQGNLPVNSINELERLYKRTEIGTDVFVYGFNAGTDWDRNVINEVLENFLMAIHKNLLSVTVANRKIDSSTLSRYLDTYNAKIKNAYWYYQVLTRPETKVFTRDFHGLGTLKLSILVDSSEKLNKKILITRSSGMKLFALGNMSRIISFSGILEMGGKELNEFFREMETPAHDKWLPSRHSTNVSLAKEYNNELRDWIRDCIQTLGEHSSDDEIEVEGLAGVLQRESDKATQSGDDNNKESLQDIIGSITIQPRTSKNKPKGLFYGSEGNGKSKNTDTEGIVGVDGSDPTTRNLGGTRHRSKKDTHKGKATTGGHDTVHKRYGGDINQELKNVRVIKTSRNTYRVSFILPRDICVGHVEIVTVGENGKSNRLAIYSASGLMGCMGVKKSSEGVSFSSMKGNEKVQFEFALLDNRDYAMEVNVYEHN